MTRERDPGQWWTEAWSPVTGCTSAGAGCDHCWARAMARRFPALHAGIPADMLEEARDLCIGEAVNPPFSTVRCHPGRLDKPLHWRKPRVVLVSMLGDLFHEQVPIGFAHRVLERAWCVNFDLLTVHLSEPHRFCFLTKRPRRAVEVFRQWHQIGEKEGWSDATGLMLMASAWDQPSADAACAAFASLPAGVRWGLHVEPMLGPVDLPRHQDIPGGPATVRASWIVCGGENGPGARPMDPRWALDLREQCRAAGVPFWFKGRGRALTHMLVCDHGLDLRRCAECCRHEDGAAEAIWERADARARDLEQTREVPW